MNAVGEVGDLAVLDRVIEIEDGERVEKLALVLVKALDLHVEDEVGRKLDALVLCDVGGELFLVGALDRAEGGQHLFDVRLHLPQLREVGVPCGADVFVDLFRHVGIVEEHPAAGRDAVRDVDELFGEAFVPIFEGIRL